MKIDIRLNSKDIRSAVQKIEQYAKDLQDKAVEFTSLLAEIGITVAKANTYVEKDDQYVNMGDLLEFSKDDVTVADGVVIRKLVVTGQVYTKTWQGGSAEVNPLLMAEFGSGWRAIEGHQGTFPNQHVAFMRPWHWIDSNGQPHESYGSEPSRPLFKAKEEMEKQILEVANSVFRT